MKSEMWSKGSLPLDADALEKKRKHEESQAALIFALLIGACAALGLILIANSPPSDEPRQTSDCAGIQSETARLSCFDALAHARSAPFKGAAPSPNGDQL